MAHHTVWLLNQTTTKAVEEKTPYEAAFSKKPDLKGLQDLGEKMYVQIKEGNKVGSRVHKGKWMGVNKESKGVRVYWPNTKMIIVEWNTYYDNLSTSNLEGEDVHITKMKADTPDTQLESEKAPDVGVNNSEQGKHI